MAEVCRYGPALSALLDAELDGAERDRVTRHLDGCATCQAELDNLCRVRAQVRSLPAREVPEGLWEPARAEASLAEGSAPRRDAERFAIAGLLVAAAFAGALAWGADDEPERAVREAPQSQLGDAGDSSSAGRLLAPFTLWD